MRWLLTPAPSPRSWPLLIAAAGSVGLYVGFSPRSTVVTILAGLLFFTAAVNYVAAVHGIRQAARRDPDRAFQRVASELRARTAAITGAPVLASLLAVTLVGAALFAIDVGGNAGAALAGIGAATFGSWSYRLVELAGNRATRP